MRFDPKLISPEPPPLDDAGELVLRDDLAELAAQLGADAEHLASLYPATVELPAKDEPATELTVHLRRSSRRLVRALALVASVAGLIAATAWWWPPAESGKHVANHGVAPVEIAEVQPAEVKLAPTMPVTIKVPEAAPPAPASPGLFLHDYSGPELEGLYDLIGEQEVGTISI